MSERRFKRDREQRLLREERRRRRLNRAAIAGGAAFCAGAFAAPAASAATFTVTNTTDGDAGSLRDAVNQANAAGTDDDIVFQSGVTGQIALTSGDIEITDAVNIHGPGASALTVSGGGIVRIFRIEGNDPDDVVSISGLTMADGYAPEQGGAIENIFTDLTISDSTIADSDAGQDDNGIGGGLATSGETTIVRSTITGNTVAQNGGKYGYGGGVGVLYGGSLAMRDSVVSGNEAERGGGGVGFYRVNSNGENLIERSTFTGNYAVAGGAVALSFILRASSPLRIDSSTLSGNTADYAGGGLVEGLFVGTNTYVTNSTISGNQATVGGGVYHYASYTDAYGPAARELHMTGVTVANNHADNAGGGIARRVGTGGVVQLTDSIVADNTTDGAGPDLAENGSPGPGDEIAARYSLIETPGSPFTDQGRNITGKDPQLGPLDNNGGPTLTQAPSLTSPVLDKGIAGGLTTDQRGMGRPFDIQGIASSPGGDGSDMGAVEQDRPAAPAPPAKTKKKKCKKKRAKGKAGAAKKKCKKKKKK